MPQLSSPAYNSMVSAACAVKCFFSIAILLLYLLPAVGWTQQAWLMTYGIGDRVEEKFGHNAIWIRDRERGVDEIYNFGFFDFDKPGFYQQFLFGEMIYFALGRSPEEELAYYRWRDREVRAQQLNLDVETIRRLAGWLDERVAPENRDFHYDYYFNNCSNRVRDALDFALDGALRRSTIDQPARLNFRQHTRRLVQDDPLLYLGIQAGLGRPADRPRSVWEEMFLPAVVARELASMSIMGSDGQLGPLVVADRLLYESTRPEPPARPDFGVGRFLSLAALSILAIVAPAVLASRCRSLGLLPFRLWLLLASAAGLVLAFLWLATDHQAAWRNENLLLFNPLMILLWRARGGVVERLVGSVVALGLLASIALKFLPGAQWNYDLMIWLLPAQAAVLWVWNKKAGPGRDDHGRRPGPARTMP
ncbi:MAG: DUF4105 domain-containing protein [Wenzhouxiangellaceae bacterium]|nr:DUF4105 domain-containing protein [Wenzhouxiangellaceae bacterium]